MRIRVRDNLPACALAAVGLLAVAWLGLASWEWTDYDSEARPALDALVNGHLTHFLQLAPAYGGSLVLRAPFVVAPKLWGGGELSMFRAAAAPGLAASAILGVWLAANLRARHVSRIAWIVAVILCVANPITLPALKYGHAEELLGAVLCVGAVLAATRRRTVLAGLLLGLAIANKQWAIVAVGPVLLALPAGRVRAALVAGGVAAAVLAPFALTGSGALAAAGSATHTGALFNPWQFWWFFGSHSHVVHDLTGQVRLGYRAAPTWVGGLARPLIVGSVLPLTLGCAMLRRRGARRPSEEGLLLLVLVLLLRFALDPWNLSYYALPFMLALVAWEALTLDRPPVLALAASLAAWLVLPGSDSPNFALSPDMQSLIFLAVVLPALLAIMVALFAPRRAERLRALGVRREASVPSLA
jgi:hypothetical protein